MFGIDLIRETNVKIQSLYDFWNYIIKYVKLIWKTPIDVETKQKKKKQKDSVRENG